jgi:2-polyprenyl-6-methoxyphenol hydroxylase-like FAD-dependent oxidoreductase
MLQPCSPATDFDVIVVGGRCAGSPLAMMLARAGLRVCILDRASFPSDTPSSHGIQPSGVKVLGRLGLLDRLLAVAEPIENAVLAFDEIRIEIPRYDRIVGAPMLNVRRLTLDAILLEAAAAAGAEVRTGTNVNALLESGGRVVGVKTAGGPLRASLVVGADGARSTVARLAGAREYARTPAQRVFAWGYFEGVDAERTLWLGQQGEHAFLASATDAGLFMAAAVLPLDRREDLRGDRDRHYADSIAGWPELRERLGGAGRIGPVRTMSRFHGFFRESAGPGWALVGDAGHFKDPTPGQGISDALRQAVALAKAIERALGGSEDPDRVLAEWWSWRDRDAWEMYWFAQDMAAGRTPLLSRTVERRFAADPEMVEDLFRVLSHELAPAKLLTPGRAAGVLSRALATGRGDRKAILREVRTLAGEQIRRERMRHKALNR